MKKKKHKNNLVKLRNKVNKALPPIERGELKTDIIINEDGNVYKYPVILEEITIITEPGKVHAWVTKPDLNVYGVATTRKEAIANLIDHVTFYIMFYRGISEKDLKKKTIEIQKGFTKILQEGVEITPKTKKEVSNGKSTPTAH